MTDGSSTLGERNRFTRRPLEGNASEGAIGVVDALFAGDEFVHWWDQIDVLGLSRQLGESEGPVGWVETS